MLVMLGLLAVFAALIGGVSIDRQALATNVTVPLSNAGCAVQ